MIFYLGIHKPYMTKLIHPIPFMLSIRRIRGRIKHIWGDDWLLDSGGFSEIQINGKYTISEEEYIDSIMRHRPKLAFCQDWMCEDVMLEITGKTVEEHQELTLASYMSLRKHTPRIAPVLQGYELDDYLEHARMYAEEGVDMAQVFGLGSVCRRSCTSEPPVLINGILAEYPEIKLHAFGIKTEAFKYKDVLEGIYSADSMAWCMRGSFAPATCEDCPYERRRCSNCVQYALIWHENVQKRIEQTRRENDISTTISA